MAQRERELPGAFRQRSICSLQTNCNNCCRWSAHVSEVAFTLQLTADVAKYYSAKEPFCTAYMKCRWEYMDIPDLTFLSPVERAVGSQERCALPGFYR